uniref:Alternative protein CHST6 n=1 Tax=Homo sapiens TaxID=9606 RepID=L8E925_HUMAN|nr:alternative protein CHST6 [Homo sapiens]
MKEFILCLSLALTLPFCHMMPSIMLGHSKKALARCWLLDLGLPSLQNCKPIHFYLLYMTLAGFSGSRL